MSINCNRSVLTACSNTDEVVYTGPDLSCTNIEYGDSLTVVIQKLDEKYCEIYNLLQGSTSTETTTLYPGSTSCNPIEQILSRDIAKETPKPASSGCCNPIADLLNNK